jgi:Tol biopolymer transport system component
VRCKLTCIGITIFFILTTSVEAQEDDFPVWRGPYFGQDPPGDTAEPFATDIFGKDLHSGPVFSADGKEVYWSPLGNSAMEIQVSRLTENGWTRPGPIKLPSGPPNSGEPCLAPDGQRLFFISQESAANDYRESIWVAERGDAGWCKPHLVSKLVNDLEIHWQLSVASNGNLYFHARPMGGGDVFVSHLVNGAYLKPVALEGGVNTEHGEGSPFIAPDESYLLFVRTDRRTGRKADIFVSFPQEDGTWSLARSVDRLNREGSHELCPTVSRDGKYLFFLRSTQDGYTPHWVSARIIEEYR